MADPDEQKVAVKKKEGLFGGSLFLKILFIIGIILIVFVIVGGFVFHLFNPAGLIWIIIGFAVGGIIIWLALKGIASLFQPKPYSPTEDFRTKLLRIAIKAKPPNINSLWVRGEDMHMKSKYGKIIGLAFIPYITSKPKKDENGNFIIQKDSKGKPMKRKFRNEKGEVVEEPLLEREKILSKDGDTLFIVPKHTGLYAVINREVEFVRCNPKYHSDLVGDVYIKDVNIVPYGDFFYPAKQWQEDIVQIMTENQAEAVAMTHSNWLDLASLYTHLSIGGDPTFQKIMLAQSERLSTPNPTA